MSIMDELSTVGGIFGSALSQLPVVGALGDYLVQRRQSDLWGGIGDDAGLLAQHTGPEGNVDIQGLAGGLLQTPGMQDFGRLLMQQNLQQDFSAGQNVLQRDFQANENVLNRQFQGQQGNLNRQNQVAMNNARIAAQDARWKAEFDLNAKQGPELKSEMFGKAQGIHGAINSGGRAYNIMGQVIDRFQNDGWEWGGEGSGTYAGAYEALIPEVAKLIDPDGAITEGAMDGARLMLPNPNTMSGWSTDKMKAHWEQVARNIRARTASKAQQARHMAAYVPGMRKFFDTATPAINAMGMDWDDIDKFASGESLEIAAKAKEEAIRRGRGGPTGGRMAR